ncbi:hypothetical protein L1049_018912 [Liquidambar formosana]|uniref:Uncharacterized protein n=1 Tax=Liquidambar formosana TaxID=63359 RepID=A0AAP0RAT7_LIQFO
MMTHFQDSKQNPKKKKKIKRRAWPHFMSCNSSNRPEADPAPIDSQPSMFHHGDNNESSQFVSSSARTFTNTNTTPAWRRDSSSSCPPWSITSLLAILPDSPSPICSSSTTSPKSFPPSSEMVYPRASNELSTPRNQDTLSDMSKPSESSKEIDEWIENANNLPCSYEPNLQSKDGSMKRSSISTVFESALTEIPSITLPTIAEDKSSLECRQSRYESPGFESPFDGRHKLMTRPKPYREFLDEIKRLELEARINAWKSARHMKYMDK